MPQFEVEEIGPERASGMYRGRTAEEAVRNAAGLDPDAEVEVEPEEDVQGWRLVRVAGSASGRIRPHQRMRFRRD